MDIFLYNYDKTEFIKFPVVPLRIEVESPQKIETFEALGIGDLKIIGIKGNRMTQINSFFPVKDYPFSRDRTYKGMEYINIIERWRETRDPMHIVISELNVNFQCVIENMPYSIQDGSGDIYYKMDIEESKPPEVKKISPGAKIKTVPDDVVFNKNSYSVVTADVLNVRSGSGKGYEEVGELTKGQRVKMLKTVGDWSQIVFNNKTAYVHSDYIRRV